MHLTIHQTTADKEKQMWGHRGFSFPQLTDGENGEQTESNGKLQVTQMNIIYMQFNVNMVRKLFI